MLDSKKQDDPEAGPVNERARVRRMHWLYVVRHFVRTFALLLTVFMIILVGGTLVVYLFATEQFVIAKTQPEVVSATAPNVAGTPIQSNNYLSSQTVVRAGQIVT